MIMVKQKSVFADNIIIGRKASKPPFALNSATICLSSDKCKTDIQGYLIVPIEQIKAIQLFGEIHDQELMKIIQQQQTRLKLFNRFKFAASMFINKLF